MIVQFEITKKDVLLQVKTEAFVTGEANKEGELSYQPCNKNTGKRR